MSLNRRQNYLLIIVKNIKCWSYIYIGDYVKKIKVLIIIVLMLFSFYLSDEITKLAINKNPIMESIKEKSDSLTVMGTNAIINENTIIPGINGKKVDEEASFFKMKEFGIFNETYLVFENIKPNISLEDNKDKIIIQGNKNLRQVSIIIDDDCNLLNYFENKNINLTILAKTDTTFAKYEYINSEKDINKFNDLESILKKNNLNKKICVLEKSNIKKCKKKKNYLVKPNIIVSNKDIIQNKKNITNGSILYIDKNVSKNTIEILINQIKHLDLKIVYLSQLISE